MSNLYVEIVLRDDLSETWLVYFEELRIEKKENERTELSGQITDYAALYGLFERLRDLNLHLLSVQVKPIFQKGSTK